MTMSRALRWFIAIDLVLVFVLCLKLVYQPSIRVTVDLVWRDPGTDDLGYGRLQAKWLKVDRPEQWHDDIFCRRASLP